MIQNNKMQPFSATAQSIRENFSEQSIKIKRLDRVFDYLPRQFCSAGLFCFHKYNVNVNKEYQIRKPLWSQSKSTWMMLLVHLRTVPTNCVFGLLGWHITISWEAKLFHTFCCFLTSHSFASIGLNVVFTVTRISKCRRSLRLQNGVIFSSKLSL